MTNYPYKRLIEPTDPEHRQLIATAIRVQDTAALSALKGKTQKPIHFVTSWFYYSLVRSGHPRPDAAVIYSPKTRLDRAKSLAHRQQLSVDPTESVLPKQPPIPLDTYAFLE